jgi:hypothetical protein
MNHHAIERAALSLYAAASADVSPGKRLIEDCIEKVCPDLGFVNEPLYDQIVSTALGGNVEAAIANATEALKGER